MSSMALFRVLSRGMDQSMTPVWRWYAYQFFLQCPRDFIAEPIQVAFDVGFQMEPNASNAAESKA